MKTIPPPVARRRLRAARADAVLQASATFWFLMAMAGQWLFVYYMVTHYGGTALRGDAAAWSDSSIVGHAAGDEMGNAMFAAHILMAVIVTFGGAFQLVPLLQRRARAWHRWNGRLFIATALLLAVGGLYLVWVRAAILTLTGAVAISINALLIIVFAVLALRDARAGQIVSHRRWALRTFLMVNGVWFFRVGFMAWIILNQGPVGSTENLDGPFDTVWAFANYLLPLVVLELYLRTQDRAGTRGKYAMAVGLAVLTMLMGVGIFGTYLFMWQPYL